MINYRVLFSIIAPVVTLLGQQAGASGAECRLEVAERSYIDGPCEHQSLSDGKGSFRITGADGRHFAYVYLEGQDRATAHWNGELGESRAHHPLGALRREGECWINDTARICVTPATVAAAGNAASHGIWDCGQVMAFELDADSYSVNGKRGAVASIERIADDAYGVTLDDGYRFALFDVTATSLTWHSPASGDTFDCRRQQ